jgi:hypothetical protein
MLMKLFYMNRQAQLRACKGINNKVGLVQKVQSRLLTSDGVHLSFFASLFLRPLAFVNMDRIVVVTCRSWLDGLMKIITSSAYKENLNASHPLLSCYISPCCCAFLKSLWRGSIAKEKHYGGEGTPLPHPPTVYDSFARLTIEQITGGGCAA